MLDMDRQLCYRPCVGIMLINHKGQIFLGKRKDTTHLCWQMPQGGIDPGESPQQAAFREMKEEIGTDKATFLQYAPQEYYYDFPPHVRKKSWNGIYDGQRQVWCLLLFTGQDCDINVATLNPEFCDWRWCDREEVLNSVVIFKKNVYASVLEKFSAHLR